MQSSSPLARLSLRVHQSRQRHGLAGIAQRLALVVLPAPPAVVPADPILPAPEPATPEQNAARERARRALIEARRTMSGVIGDEVVVADLTNESIAPAITPDWEQLQAYLEESERERVSLREELTGLREVVRIMQSRLDDFERALPATAAADPQPSTDVPAPTIEEMEAESMAAGAADEPEPAQAMLNAAEPSPEPPSPIAAVGVEEPTEDDDQVRELRERVLRALRDRVFAAGTVGTKVFVSPTPDEPALRDIIERFHDDPLVEHAEPVETKEDGTDAALIRVTLRAPMRWGQFGALLERALDRPIAQGDVRWSQGAVRVQLPSERLPAEAETRPNASAPCA